MHHCMYMCTHFLSGAQLRSRARRRDRRAGGTTIHPMRLNKTQPIHFNSLDIHPCSQEADADAVQLQSLGGQLKKAQLAFM